MGADITDPLKACCCANLSKADVGNSNTGATPGCELDDYLNSNMD